MKKGMQKIFLMLCMSVTSMVTLVAFSAPPPAGNTDFANQNTEFLPGVPKTPTTATTDLFDDQSGSGTVNGLLGSIKTAINRVLGLLALIALIILIIQGITMLINAKDSKKIEEGYTTVKNVAIALVFIGISWLVISFIFRAIGVFTGS